MAAQQDEAKTIGDLVAKLVAKLVKVGDRGKYVCALEILERVALEHFNGDIGAAFKPTMDALARKTHAFISNYNNDTIELELIQHQMTQKPMLRCEGDGAPVRAANKPRSQEKKGGVCVVSHCL